MGQMFGFSDFKREYAHQLGNQPLFDKMDCALQMLSSNTNSFHQCPEIAEFGRQNLTLEKKNDLDTRFQDIWKWHMEMSFDNFPVTWPEQELLQFHHFVQQARGFASFCHTVLFFLFFFLVNTTPNIT